MFGEITYVYRKFSDQLPYNIRSNLLCVRFKKLDVCKWMVFAKPVTFALNTSLLHNAKQMQNKLTKQIYVICMLDAVYQWKVNLMFFMIMIAQIAVLVIDHFQMPNVCVGEVLSHYP